MPLKDKNHPGMAGGKKNPGHNVVLLAAPGSEKKEGGFVVMTFYPLFVFKQIDDEDVGVNEQPVAQADDHVRQENLTSQLMVTLNSNKRLGKVI